MVATILIVADIHANPVAFNAVLDDAGRVDLILCAGDLVDYNPWPLETLSIVEEKHVASVLGNHDRDCITGSPIGCNSYAQRSCVWTHNELTSGAIKQLQALPESFRFEVEGQTLFLCHGSPRDLVDEYVFPPPETPKEVLRDYLGQVQANILVMGHTHVPFLERFPEGWVMNPGSVGQPRDADPRASYAILDVDGTKTDLALRRVEYNVEKVVSEIIAVGLPSFLAKRLYQGM